MSSPHTRRPPDPMTPHPFLALFAAAVAQAPAAADRTPEAGEVRFASDDARHGVPERFRLDAHTFRYEARLKYDLPRSGVEVLDVRFPSPVRSGHPENDTVHCELFRPKKPGKFPAVVVLDILDGKQVVSRGEALWLAQHDIAALVVILPYYGPRRPPESRDRLLSPDVERSVENVRQGVLDCRRAVAWLAARPDVDADRLGVVGTSLGSFVGGVLAASEPRLGTACLLLGGGGLVDAFWSHPRAAPFHPILQFLGVTKDGLARRIAPVDPLTYADQLRSKRLLLVAASRDDVVPPDAMRKLWEATGKPKIVWFDATHVGAAAFAFPAMEAVIRHLKE